MKKCPFCAEEIQDAAIKCRHCGSMLSAPVAPPPEPAAPPAPVPPQKPLAQRTVIILCLAGGALLGLAFLDDCVASRNNRPSILNQIERAFR